MITEQPDAERVTRFNEALRRLWVVRWTAEEVLAGYKVLRGNYRLYLDVALTQGSIVKLDTIAKLSRYIEVTNFMFITQRDRYGNVMVWSEELGDYQQSLLEDVYHYYPINPLKAIKRLWMYLAYFDRLCDLTVFTPLFSSDIALTSQIISDIEVAELLLSRPDLPYDREFLQQSLTERLRLLPNVPSVAWNMEALTRLREQLQREVNEATYQWLDDHQINIWELLA